MPDEPATFSKRSIAPPMGVEDAINVKFVGELYDDIERLKGRLLDVTTREEVVLKAIELLIALEAAASIYYVDEDGVRRSLVLFKP